MANQPPLRSQVPFETTLMVRDTCLCLQTQRAARSLARRFDLALRPLGLTNGQFSLLMSLNRPRPVSIGAVATTLGMDRTTVTAALKPLQRKALVSLVADPDDGRSRLLALTADGHGVLQDALPVWKAVHGEIDDALGADAGGLHRALAALVLV
jgi:DNA-binding MarR family transcriptional regulator